MVIFIKVIVIGGGASGLVAAIYASLNNDVTILEKIDWYEEDGDTTGDSDALSCGHARAESGAAAFA